MAWARFQEGNSLFHLTDGYITEATRKHDSGSAKPTIESRIADHLYTLANRTYLSSSGNRMIYPRPLDVWVVGKSGWLTKRLPEPIQSICNGETDDTYRIIIACEGLEGIQTPHVPGWPDWTYASGMKRKKRHQNIKEFKHVSEMLLGVMHDYYDEMRIPPTAVFEDLNIPVVYTGASEYKRDDAPS